MKNRIIEICELGQPQSIIHRENEPITELIKTEVLIKEINEAINYTHSCMELKDKNPLTFKEWKKVNKYTICTDETWFVSPEVGYITTKELKKRYKKHYNL